MGWLAIITTLLPLLLKLLEWITKQQDAGKELSERQQKKLNRVIGVANQIKAKAVKMGCNPNGSEEDE